MPKIDYRKKGYPNSNLSTGGPRWGYFKACEIPESFPSNRLRLRLAGLAPHALIGPAVSFMWARTVLAKKEADSGCRQGPFHSP